MRVNFSLIVLAALILFSCKKENKVENTPQNNFKVLWDDFNANYPVFQLNNINWDSVYTVNYSKINAGTSDYALFSILKSSILTLKDAHSDIISNQYGSTNYYNVFVQQKPANFLGWNVMSKYVPTLTTVNLHIAYGFITNSNIGYIFIGSFNDNQNDYNFIDVCLDKFQNTKGIIIDIRQNDGGNEINAQTVASRLSSQSVIYRYSRNRNGLNYSDYYPMILNPNGKNKYLKTVVLLTNRRTFSAAEDFTLMLRSLPNVVHIGDTTFGGVATNPIAKPLPNGWTYRMARTMECDRNKVPIKGGIVPQFVVQISKSDSINGVDKIIEAAINKINEK